MEKTTRRECYVMTVTIQLYDLDLDNHDGRDAGWWTSADGQRQIDMTGSTVSAAVEELLAQGHAAGVIPELIKPEFVEI